MASDPEAVIDDMVKLTDHVIDHAKLDLTAVRDLAKQVSAATEAPASVCP